MCGNWGLLCLLEFLEHHNDRTPQGMLPDLLEKLLKGMIRVIELRGAQAGGLNLLQGAKNVQQCRVRVLKPKRGDLGQVLFQAVRRALRRSRLRRLFSARWFDAPYEQILVQGHSRFGTSSSPAVVESHPHQWSPAENCSVWGYSPELGWHRRVCTYTLTITHNGDFDAWTPYRKTTIGVGDLSLWLSRVLAVENTTRGDSRNIAGVLELLACQGMWYHSVRQAYHLHVATHVDQACGWMPLSRDAPHVVPNRSALQIWANIMEKEFEKFVDADRKGASLTEADGRFAEFLENCTQNLCQGISGDLLKKWVPPSKIRNFVLAAVEGFRDNDLMCVTTAFLRRAEGTFGLSVTSSTCPNSVIIAARGQPMSIGFGGCLRGASPTIAYWSSERAAFPTLNKEQTMIDKRFDLNDEVGEVIELRAASLPLAGMSGIVADDTFAVCLNKGDSKESTVSTDLKANVAEEHMPKYLVARGLDFSVKAEVFECWSPNLLTRESFQKRLVPIMEKIKSSSTHLEPATRWPALFRSQPDCVAKDIRYIPWIVREIDLTWSDPKSLNRISSDNFSKGILKLMHSKREGFQHVGSSRSIDLIVFGIENSLWLGQQFVADLQRLFPSLNILAMSSNVLLGLLQRGAGHVNPSNWPYSEDSLCIGKDTIGLALSHSGTTYPTVWAARLLRLNTEHVFALSNSFDGLLACSIGQGPDEEFQGLLFSTLVGTKPAEAATVATVAIHHTLSHLLLQCAASATGANLPSLQTQSRSEILQGVVDDEFEDTSVSTHNVCTASATCVKDMQRLLLSMYKGVSSACGVTADGHEISGTHSELVRAGHRWSHHITEGYWATFLAAAYVAITVIPGFLPATEFGTWLAHHLHEDDDYEFPEYAVWLLRILDSILYIFMGIIVAMIHRMLTGRRLWARFTTRTLLLVECTVNYKLLRAYASKLVALSYRFSTINVVGQNGADHMVHEFTHKAQSDVLMAVGLPDGRLPSTAPVESCFLLSASQAQYIKRTGQGVEAYCLGHNTWTRPNLFVRALKLPTFRPIFATEKMLFSDQLHSHSKVPPGCHGTNPGEIVQRRRDMLKQLDPYGLPLRVTPADLVPYMALDEVLSFDKALLILETIIEKHCVDAHVEMVPLGLRSFLAEFAAEHAGSAEVFVHSPCKAYASPKTHFDDVMVRRKSSYKAFMEATPCKSFLQEVVFPGAKKKRQTSEVAMSKAIREDSTVVDLEAAAEAVAEAKYQEKVKDISNRLDQFLTVSENRGKEGDKHVIRCSDITISASDALATTLDMNAFLALLHGKELQTWVRSARYRWSKICKMRGILSFLAEEQHMTGRSAFSAVLSSGRTLKMVVLSWRKKAVQEKEIREEKILPFSGEKSPRSPRSSYMPNVSNASIAEVKRNASSTWRTTVTKLNSEHEAEEGAKARLICEDLVNIGASASEVIHESRPAELFYESRVASAERLVSWFVLLHAMATPSSRLPFLSYELGKSESRLRVASTPAPVPFSGFEEEQAHAADSLGSI